jgi:hypothetical protein
MRSFLLYAIQTNPLTFGSYGPASGSGTWSLLGSVLRMISANGRDTTDVNVGINGKNGTFVYNSTTVLALPVLSEFRVTRTAMVAISAIKQ